ncbi:Condensation domain-containing protein [Actinomadura madurae]|uniref:Condensation domain-containing protein n=1 Tax=Actinomadura madurae TaxID=1993 RepID=A0A1I5GVC6_9ACTN|nr:condensation domain-containing protein [Actinomadura madurae]SFO40004.1 Condensation domain-containing protein [Actinomadura madurae]
MAAVTWRSCRFSGAGAAIGPATCGQKGLWLDIAAKDHRTAFFNPSKEVEVPAGLSVGDLLASLRTLVVRHQSLRTVLYRDGDGALTQEVRADGAIDVPLVEIGDDAAALWDAVADHRRDVERRPFDLAADLPLRPAVFLSGGKPVAVLLCTAHTAADGTGVGNLAADYGRLLAARTGGDGALPPARQPLEQALYERSARGRRRLSKALRHWRTVLETAPRTMFPTEPDGPPRYHAGTLYSRAVGPALNAAARRYAVSGSTVLLAATAAALGRHTGMPRCPVQLISANRFADAEVNAVACMIQGTPAVIDLDRPRFRDVVEDAWEAAIRALRHGVYDRDRLPGIIASAQRRRGVALDLSCFFNDMRARTEPDAAPAAATDAAALAEAARDTRFRVEDAVEQEKFALYAENASTYEDETDELVELVRLTVHADARFVDPGELRALLSGIENLLVQAACREVRMDEIGEVTGIAPPVRTGRWVLHDGCWVDLDAVERMLREAVDVTDVRVEAGRAPDGTEEIVARLWPRAGGLTAEDVRAACLRALPGRQTAVVPGRFVLEGGA